MATKMGQLKTAAAALKTETVAIDSVKLWADNPRKNDVAVPKLAAILQEHGQRSPLVVWRKNRTIYKGNTTWKAAKALGWKTVEVIFADFPSDQVATAYGIADNVSSEWSDWDTNVLGELLRADESGEYFNKKTTGMAEKSLAALRLSEAMPDRLGNVDFAGESAAVGDFLILNFESPEDFAAFKERFGLGKNERAIMYSMLAEYFA